MRITRNQIVHGVAGYIKDEIIPKMERPMQIVAAIAVNSAVNNDRLMDSLFDNEMISSLLGDDGTGAYDISGLITAVHDAMDAYGNFPVRIPSIPFISPSEITLTITAEDIRAMQRRIEG